MLSQFLDPPDEKSNELKETSFFLSQFEEQRKERRCFALFPDWKEYENRKRSLSKHLKSTEYVQAIRKITDEIGI